MCDRNFSRFDTKILTAHCGCVHFFFNKKKEFFTKECFIDDKVDFGKTFEVLAALLVVGFPLTFALMFYVSSKGQNVGFILLILRYHIAIKRTKTASAKQKVVSTAHSTLAIVPANLRKQWLKNGEHFLNNFSVMVYHGSAKSSNINMNKMMIQSLTRDNLWLRFEKLAATYKVKTLKEFRQKRGGCESP